MRNWTSWVPGSVLGLGCLLTLGVNRQHQMPLRLSLDSIPMRMVGINGMRDSVGEKEAKAAGMSSYIRRWYLADTATFEVYVGYYTHQTQGRTIHSPKNCLPGSGWEALQQSVATVETPDGPIRVNRYLLQQQEARALVFYWYQGRGRVAANEYQVKWDLLRDSAVRGRSEEALVRVMVPLDSTTSEAAATERARAVAAALIPEVTRVLPAW